MPNLSDYNPALKYGANLDVNVDLADIRDANGNELLELDTVSSAVNFARLANAVTGVPVDLSAQGDDTNVGMRISSKGTGSVTISTGNFAREGLIIVNTASAVNELTITPAATGTAVIASPTGDDGNIDLQLNPKGTAVVLVGEWGTAQVSQVAAGAGAGVTINAQKGSITVPDFDISSGSSFIVNLTNNKLYDTANPRFLLTSVGRGGNTINGVFSTQTDVGSGSALITVISSTTTVQDGSIVVNFVVL